VLQADALFDFADIYVDLLEVFIPATQKQRLENPKTGAGLYAHPT